MTEDGIEATEAVPAASVINPYAVVACSGDCDGYGCYGYETYIAGKQNGYITLAYTPCRICEGTAEIALCPVCSGGGYEGVTIKGAASSAKPTRRCGPCKGRGVVAAFRLAELPPPPPFP